MSQKKKIVLIAVGFIVLIIVLLMFPYAVYSKKIPLGVKVAGLKLGLLSESESIHLLEEKSDELEEKTVIIRIGNDTTKVAFRELGLSIAARRTVENIKSQFQKPNIFLNYLTYAHLFYLPKDLEPIIAVDAHEFQRYYKSLLANYSIEPKDAQLIIDENGKATVRSSSKGRIISEKKLKKELVEAFKSNKRTVSLEYEVLNPDISTEEAKKKLDELSDWKNKRVVFYKGFMEAEISGEPLVKYLYAIKEKGRLEIAFSPNKIGKFLDKNFGKFGRQPVNASFKIVSGEVVVVPHKNGFMPDSTVTAKLATSELRRSDSARVEVVFSERRPVITTEKAKSMGIKEEISSFTTSFNPGQTSRVVNIKLLARLLDGQLVAPGEIFLFNERIGPRTLERGFRLAPTIVNGRLVDTAGGGACQVATTLFNTVFFAGLEVVERMNHSFYISKYPAGRDATVSYWGYDLKFKNDYKHWILIKAYATSSRITITFYGTKEGRKVKFETSRPTNFVSFKTLEKKDPNLPLGYRKVEEAGITGRTIIVRRWVYDAAGRLIHQDVFRSRYSPKAQVVVVGTKVVEKPKNSSETTGSATN